jgi:flagellar L-ring protein precursor FlgH
MTAKILRCVVLLAIAAQLDACTMFRDLKNVGRPPPLSPIVNPTAQRGYEPVSMPMPASPIEHSQNNSLWRTGAKAFFRDQRAAKVGDILTVDITIADNAKINNQTSASRVGTENMGLTNLIGLENPIAHALGHGVDLANLVKTNSDSESKGNGQIQRDETINTTIAAIITQILPNGNLVIAGKQEVRVNNEVREMDISGIVRPEDISNTNTINQTQIAEARISYGGRGDISRIQQPRYGQQVLDIVSPF